MNFNWNDWNAWKLQQRKKGQMVLLKDLPLFFIWASEKSRNCSETRSISNCQCSCVDFHLHPLPSGADCSHKHKPRMERMALSVVSLPWPSDRDPIDQTEMPKKRCSVPTASHAHGARDSPPEWKSWIAGCWGWYNAHLVDHVWGTQGGKKLCGQNLKSLFRWFCLPKNTFWRSSQTKGKHELWEHYLSKSTNPSLYPRHKEGNGFQPRMWHKPTWLLHLHILRNQLHQWTANQTIASMLSFRSIKSHEL